VVTAQRVLDADPSVVQVVPIISTPRGFVDRVDRERERAVVTRNGRPASVLTSPDDLDSMEEALELLCEQSAVKGLVDQDLRSKRPPSR